MFVVGAVPRLNSCEGAEEVVAGAVNVLVALDVCVVAPKPGNIEDCAGAARFGWEVVVLVCGEPRLGNKGPAGFDCSVD